MRPLTERQQRVLDYIRSYIAEHGYPPTWREIGGAIGIKSTNGVREHIVALAKKGKIRVDPRKKRAITVVDDWTAALAPDVRREALNLATEIKSAVQPGTAASLLVLQLLEVLGGAGEEKAA